MTRTHVRTHASSHATPPAAEEIAHGCKGQYTAAITHAWTGSSRVGPPAAYRGDHPVDGRVPLLWLCGSRQVDPAPIGDFQRRHPAVLQALNVGDEQHNACLCMCLRNMGDEQPKQHSFP
eukprot:364298-Chlamydomonas_euryale.AAC.2